MLSAPIEKIIGRVGGTMGIDAICNKVKDGCRIDDQEFLQLEKQADIYQLGFLAGLIRKRLHPENTVTYVIDRNINYTDICISACKFCAFFKAPEHMDGKVLTFPELQEKIKETQSLGGTQILLQGGFIQICRWIFMKTCFGL